MYQMPVRAIKSLLKQELNSFRDGFYNAYPKFIMADVMKEMVSISFHSLNERLENCNSYEELDDYISFAGYRISLEEWINSLGD